MSKRTVFYDFHEDHIRPFIMALRFQPHELDWTKSTLYIPLSGPFQPLMLEEVPELEAGITVLLDDLVIHPERPHTIGISLNSIQQRHAMQADSLPRIVHLWLRMSDIEEVLQMDSRSYYAWSPN
ncbi:hypothetical protein HQN90_11755 [Paenibacillus alba]|uniref:hypothetical protein n=1 Tax=Paenibacillus alba TaxID=1197127 RepID=UPI001564AB63|nr:hypothetical protein [Paenibacillus alba]NQX66798.1 hypothetical protein [Paenibacillus alba]